MILHSKRSRKHLNWTYCQQCSSTCKCGLIWNPSVLILCFLCVKKFPSSQWSYRLHFFNYIVARCMEQLIMKPCLVQFMLSNRKGKIWSEKPSITVCNYLEVYLNFMASNHSSRTEHQLTEKKESNFALTDYPGPHPLSETRNRI